MKSSRGEIKICDILDKAGLVYQEEYSFPDLVSSSGRPLRFDFAVFDDNGDIVYDPTTIVMDETGNMINGKPMMEKVMTTRVKIHYLVGKTLLETDEEYIKFIRSLDILFNHEKDSYIEKRFCKKYNIPFEGKVSTYLILVSNGLTSVYREVKTLEYDEKQKYFIINGIKRDDISLVYKKAIKFEWDDKICVATDDRSAANVIKHYKELLVRIKKQEIEKDF